MNAIKVDDAHRIRLQVLKPGDLYEPDIASADLITLRRVPPPTRVAARPANVRFVKRDGYTVALTDQPFSLAAIKEALAEFP